jgi:hypothetical protein
MSNTWKQYSGINKLDNTRLDSIVANNLILKNGYNGDLKIIGNLMVGNITAFNINLNNLSISNDISIDGNLIANNNAIFNGDLITNGNVLINGTISFDNNLNTTGDLGVGGNINIGNNATINGNIYIPPNFIFSDIDGVGINTKPIATFDISGNNIQSLNVYSNNLSTYNVIAQNNQNRGLLIAANTISTSIQFFNDISLNYPPHNANSQIKYTTGGNLDIDVSNNVTINSKLTIIPSPNFNQDIIKHTPLAETTTIYDISSGIFLPSIYENTNQITGSTLTLLSTDSSSNTFLHIKTRFPYKGFSIGGGSYPLDETRSMGTFGYTDPSSNIYNSAQMIVSGNNNINNTITTGINTYQPITEKYALDINGETRIHSGDLRYNTPPFCVYSISSYNGNIIAIGGYKITPNPPYRHFAYCSTNGGNTWNIFSLSSIGNIDNTTIAFIVGQNGFKGYTNNNGVNWRPYTLSYNSSNLPYNSSSFYAFSKDTLNTRCFISYNDNNALNIPTFYFDISTNAIYNNTLPSIINVTSNTIGTIQQIKAMTANNTTLYLLSDNVNNLGIYYLYSTPLLSPTTITTLAIYNSTTFIPKSIVTNGSFLAIGGSDGIYSSQNSGLSFNFLNLSNITINTFSIYSNTQCLAFGKNGEIYYTINAGINWIKVSNDILNSSGTYGYLKNSIFNNINTATFVNANTVLFNGYTESNNTNSNIYSLYAPNLFNSNYNNVLDVSGSIKLSGAINVNDGGFFDSNNSSFYILNSPSDNIYFGNNASYLYFGNVSGNGLTTINNNTSFLKNVSIEGNLTITGGTSITVDTSNAGITTYTNLTDSYKLKSGALIIYGGSSIDGNLFLGGNLVSYSNSYIGKDLFVNGNIQSNNNYSGNTYVNNFLTIGSTIPSTYKLQVNGNANISTHLFVNGNISIGKINPGFSLDVSGIINASALYVNGNPYIGSQWTSNGTTINYATGNVGIGTINPLYNLDINGNLHTTKNFIVDGNISVGKINPGFSLDVSGIVNASALYVNGNPYIGTQWTTNGTTINYATGNVGIGTINPLYNLDITGNVFITSNNLNPILLGNIGTQLHGIDLGSGDINRGNISNSGKIMYGPTTINGNSLVIIGKGTNTNNRNIDLFDNTTINGNLIVNNAINAYTTKTINGTPYTGLIIQKTNPQDATFNLSLIDISNSFVAKRTLGFNSFANSKANNGITRAGDHQIIYTDDITSGGLTNCGLTIAPYDTNTSGIRLDSNGFLGICKNASTYSAPLDVGKSAGGTTGIQTRTIQGIENVNSQQVLHIIQPVTSIESSPSLANVGYNSIYNLTSNNIYDISAGLSIGWSSQTATNINTGTTDFLNWGNYYDGGFTFYSINNNKKKTPQILCYIDSSDNKTSINKYPNYTENTPYNINFDVSGSGRFVQDCSSLIIKCYNRSSSQNTGTRLIFDTDGFVGTTSNSFPNTFISAIQDAINSATLNFATNNQLRMTISYNGLVGIGTTTPQYNLDVIGNARFTTNIFSGNIYSYGFVNSPYYEQSNGTINLRSTSFPSQTYNLGMNGINSSVNSGLQIGWNSSTINGETNLLNWAQTSASGGFTFNSISSSYSNTQLGSILKGTNISNNLIANAVFNMNGPINATQFYVNGTPFANINQWTTNTPSGISYNGIYGNYVGICGTNTSYMLYVNGTIGSSSSITGSSFNATSDYRIKENPQKIDTKKYNVDNLNPVSYNNLKTNLFDFGLIAHEVQDNFPFLVNGKKDDDNLQTLNYIALIPILIAEIQQLKKEVKELKLQ